MNIKKLASICDAISGLATNIDKHSAATVATVTIGALHRLANAVEVNTLNEVCREMQEYAEFQPAAGPAHLVKAFADALRKPQAQARSEDPPDYGGSTDVIAQALAILQARVIKGDVLSKPQDVKDYLRLRLAPFEHEVFAVLFLTGQHQVIEFAEMFRGTLTQTSVYPREVVKQALALNAGAVIFAHNHPSGHHEPSRADEHLTQALKQALALVDVRVLDHIVVSASGCMSFAERGLL